jgi:hypothetical protein
MLFRPGLYVVYFYALKRRGQLMFEMDALLSSINLMCLYNCRMILFNRGHRIIQIWVDEPAVHIIMQQGAHRP